MCWQGPRVHAAYAVSHLGPERIVLRVVSHRQDIVAARVESHRKIPVRPLVGSAHIEHALHQSRIARHKLVWPDAHDVPYKDGAGLRRTSARNDP